jgi:hypothetical protein
MKAVKVAAAPAESKAASPRPPAAAQAVNPVMRTLNNLVGALGGLIPSVTR